MRISDWSSDVCSSDLEMRRCADRAANVAAKLERREPRRERRRRTARRATRPASQIPRIVGCSVNVVICLKIARQDRKSVVEGKSVSVRVDLVGRRILKKKKTK